MHTLACAPEGGTAELLRGFHRTGQHALQFHALHLLMVEPLLPPSSRQLPGPPPTNHTTKLYRLRLKRYELAVRTLLDQAARPPTATGSWPHTSRGIIRAANKTRSAPAARQVDTDCISTLLIPSPLEWLPDFAPPPPPALSRSQQRAQKSLSPQAWLRERARLGALAAGKKGVRSA